MDDYELAALASCRERPEALFDDFLAFMRDELAQMPCCCENSGDHQATPPMMWPELIQCIASRKAMDYARPLYAELVQVFAGKPYGPDKQQLGRLLYQAQYQLLREKRHKTVREAIDAEEGQ